MKGQVRYLVPATLFLLVCACGLIIPSKRLVPFNEAEYLPYAQEGTAFIYGEVFVNTKWGVKKAVESKVLLTPVTSYSTEWFDRRVIKKELLQPADANSLKYQREVVTDQNGHFVFTNVTPGEYYVTSMITWWLIDPIFGHKNSMRAHAHARISVEEGKIEKVIVTRLPERQWAP